MPTSSRVFALCPVLFRCFKGSGWHTWRNRRQVPGQSYQQNIQQFQTNVKQQNIVKHPWISTKLSRNDILKYHDISMEYHDISDNFTKPPPPWILKCLFASFQKHVSPKLSQNRPWRVVRLCHMGLGSKLRIIFGLGDVGEIPNVSPLEFEKICSKNPSKTIQTDMLHKSPKPKYPLRSIWNDLLCNWWTTSQYL